MEGWKNMMGVSLAIYCYSCQIINDLLSGHFVPSKGNWRKFLVNYMKDPLGPHMSPTAPSGASAGVTEASGHGSYKSALVMRL